MYFNIKVEKIDETEWQVRIVRISPSEKLIHTRSMLRKGVKPFIFPQPPVVEQAKLSTTDVHYKLCTTADVTDIQKMYASVAGSGGLSKNEVEVFGRYLFASLIGEEAWGKIDAEAADEPVEFTFSWGDTEWELHRLPWEMMRNADGALAAHLRVSIARAVPDAKYKGAEISLRPKVLFIVGADLNDANIRSGAEYLGLLHRLESLGIIFCSRILHRATSQQIEDEINSFQPSIVHFICHGWFDVDGRGYLDVTPEKPANPPQRLYASSLLPMLETANGLPPVVVLNACYTATPPLARESPPIAVELVKGGIPIVVGMGGRVADSACRLFTRRFYEALLQGGSVAAAAAHGRRAGIIHLGAQAERVVDWALPTLFIAEGLSPQVALDTAWVTQNQQRNVYANEYRKTYEPTLFCDRYDLIDNYYRLLNKPTKAPGGTAAFPYSVIAVEVDSLEPAFKEPQYGKTRLLREMSLQAARDGHIPCLITFDPGVLQPTTSMQLGKSIMRAIHSARCNFGLGRPDYEFARLEQKQADSAVAVHQDVQDELDLGSLEGKVVRAAVQLDLLALQEEASKKFANPNLKVVVLLDEVHRFDDGAREFVYQMLGSGGLGSADNPVPVVFTFMGVSTDGSYNAAIQMLKTFLENRPLFVNHQLLGAFPPPKDEWLLYQQFLLCREEPLVVRADAEDKVHDFYNLLYEGFKGVPSQLKSKEVKMAISAAKIAELLVPANDDEVLRMHPWGKGNGS